MNAADSSPSAQIVLAFFAMSSVVVDIIPVVQLRLRLRLRLQRQQRGAFGLLLEWLFQEITTEVIFQKIE